jgi:hypothetical protein
VGLCVIIVNAILHQQIITTIGAVEVSENQQASTSGNESMKE